MINFLYTNIGRGHPFYLDGIIETLQNSKNYNQFNTRDVFEISKGESKAAWQFARKLYKIGSTDSIIGKLYNKLRDSSEYDKASLAMKIMGRDIKKRYANDENPLVVAHPILVGMLNGKKNLFYQHGEIAVPKQAVVNGAETVFVPTEKCKAPFVQAGYSEGQVIVTGLCIESSAVSNAERAFQNRVARIKSVNSLTGAFFSSGAEPKPHVEKIVKAAESFSNRGNTAYIFAEENGRLDKILSQKKFDFGEKGKIAIFGYNSREKLDEATRLMLDSVDLFVAPSHERTNWALGLGLPMFVLDPPIGPFAPLNRAALLEAGVAMPLESEESVSDFGDLVNRLKTMGELQKMAENGWNRYSINGFETISDYLINKYSPNS